MGLIIIRDGTVNRQFRTDELPGKVEIDLSGSSPEIIVPEDLDVRKRARPRDSHLKW